MSNNNYNAASIPPPYDTERRIYNSGGYNYNDEPKSNRCLTIMSSIPYLTILGVVLLATGCAFIMYGYKTFAPGVYETYKAMNFNETLSGEWCKDCAKFIDDEAEKGKDSYYSPENPTYIIVDSCLAGAAVIFLLVVAIFSTGSTRENCCQAHGCCQGYAMFVHFTTGIVVLLFFLVFAMAGMVLTLPALLTSYLDDKCTNDESSKACFSAADFGLSVPSSTEDIKLCFGDDNVCSRMDDMKLGFYYAMSGCFGAAIGLVFVLMANAANFAHFRDMKKVESEEKYVF